MSFPMGRFSEDIKTVLVGSYASANSDRTSEVIDTKGFGGCQIEVIFAVVSDSVTEAIYLTSSDAVTDENTLSSGANVATSNQSVVGTTADNTIQYFDFIPEKRYYQVVVDKDASNSSAELIVAHLYNAKDRPITNATGNTTVGEGTGAVSGEMMGLAVQGTK